MDVFVSHANRDRAIVDGLLACLESDNAASWRSIDFIQLRDDWKVEAQRVIAQADAFLFVTTERSVRSESCLHELDLAQAAAIPVWQWLPYGSPTAVRYSPLAAVRVLGIGLDVAPAGWTFTLP